MNDMVLIEAATDGAARLLWTRALRSHDAARLALVLRRPDTALATDAIKAGSTVITGPCDPHVLLPSLWAVYADAMTDLVVLALLAKRQVDLGADSQVLDAHHRERVIALIVEGTRYRDPFTGVDSTAAAITDLLVEWRRVIVANRGVAVCAGMSLWKRRRITQFFATANAAAGPPFRRGAAAVLREARRRDGAIAAWSTRLPAGLADAAARGGIALHLVEDGFVRSLGLGSDLLPPASIIVDGQGIYFDPSRPSDLETLLATTIFNDALRARGRRLVDALTASGVSKYASGGAPPALDFPTGRRVLLIPGQVADDLSVRLAGGGAIADNLALLRRVRADNPDAFLVYRPHPDVDAGHRPGAVPDHIAASLADRVSRGGAIAALLSRVDEVHTLTSLAGFEALLRGRRVVTYGQPFYAGWGLTIDHAPPQPRRGRRLVLEELAAAALILYPRYVDPVTGLPCPPETLLSRLGDPSLWRPTWLMRLRRLQGRARRSVSEWRSAAEHGTRPSWRAFDAPAKGRLDA